MSSFYSANGCHNVSSDVVADRDFIDIPAFVPIQDTQEVKPASRFVVLGMRANIERNEAMAKAKLQGKLAKVMFALADLETVLPGMDDETTIGGLAFIVGE